MRKLLAALALFLSFTADAAVTTYARYALPTGTDITTRPSEAYLYFYCDTEAELPSVNVVNGDKAYSVDTGKRWNRTGDSWVLQTTDNLASTLQTTAPTILSIGTITDGEYLKRDGSSIVSAAIAGGGDMLKTENLSGLANYTTARSNLGLGSLATQSGTFSGTSSGTNTGDQTITLTGDVTGSGTGSFAATIATSAVTLAKMSDMATASILGRNTVGTGVPEVLSAATTKSLLSLNNVENTALSTWAGTANVTTLGTIGTGTWNATAIADGKIAAALTGKTYNGLTVTSSTGTLTITNAKTLSASNTLTLAGTDGTTITFPSTSATLARTDAVNTFTGTQTFSNAISYGGVTLSAAVTGTGNMVLASTPTLTTPVIGVATGTSLALSGDATTTGGKVGYATGAGGTVTQATNKSTGVTLNKQCGAITMNGAALAAAAEVTFTVTNSTMAADDVVVVNHKSAGTLGAYATFAHTNAAGSFKIMVGNMSAGSLSEAIVLSYCIIKGATS